MTSVPPELDASRDDALRTPATSAASRRVAERSADDTDLGWGDRDSGSNDEQLSRDKPPHW